MVKMVENIKGRIIGCNYEVIRQRLKEKDKVLTKVKEFLKI